MTLLRVLVLLGLGLAHPALAGAWLREEGTGFLAVSGTVYRSAGIWSTETKLYADYGLKPGISIGLDIHERPNDVGHVFGFARLPLPFDNLPGLFAVELGAGASHQQGQWSELLKAAFAWGRGFESGWGHGWVALDAAIERRGAVSGPIFKFDAVTGLSSGMRARPMIKLETARIPGAPMAWTLTPTLLIDARNDLTWEIGIERTSDPNRKTGLKIGIWRRF